MILFNPREAETSSPALLSMANVLSPATSREPAEVSNWVCGFMKAMLLAAKCNPHGNLQHSLSARLHLPTEVGCWGGTGCTTQTRNRLERVKSQQHPEHRFLALNSFWNNLDNK